MPVLLAGRPESPARRPGEAISQVRDAGRHAACARVLSLPCYPELRADEIQRVIAALTAAQTTPRREPARG